MAQQIAYLVRSTTWQMPFFASIIEVIRHLLCLLCCDASVRLSSAINPLLNSEKMSSTLPLNAVMIPDNCCTTVHMCRSCCAVDWRELIKFFCELPISINFRFDSIQHTLTISWNKITFSSIICSCC